MAQTQHAKNVTYSFFRRRSAATVCLLLLLGLPMTGGCDSGQDAEAPATSSSANEGDADATQATRATEENASDLVETAATDAEVGVLPDVPPVPREFRAAWVATVANIDWPTEPGLSTQAQQDELIAILDRCVELNLNAVIFQVRPAGDAFYPSELEPWSAWLTGASGVGPDPAYDPLAFAVEQAHARGIELHAWFNPYRAGHPSMPGTAADSHIVNAQPDLVREVGAYAWMDPGDPEVVAHTLAVMFDVVERYDIDGVHMDDYFYPYPSYNDDAGFPDDDTYAAHVAEVGEANALERNDWRRNNVNQLVRQLYEGVRERSATCMVGISPFGIWRPGHPEQIKGFDAYDAIYADALHWWHEGWVDYFTPQLYWPIAEPDQSFVALFNWWANENTHGRHLWPGLYLTKGGFEDLEIARQIRWSRILSDSRTSAGHAHFSMKGLMDAESPRVVPLAESVYTEQALVPASPWMGDVATLPAPVVQMALAPGTEGNGTTVAQITLESIHPDAQLWVVQVGHGDRWTHGIYSVAQTGAQLTVPAGDANDDSPMRVICFAVDGRGVTGEPVEMQP